MKQFRQIHLLPALATLLFVGFVGLAFAAYPHPFSLINTNISRLGRPSMNPDGHGWLFIALFATNVPLFLFYATLGRWKQGQPAFDRVIDLVTALNYLNGSALLMLAIYHADHFMPHRIFGSIYFGGSAIVMLLACWLIPRHPLMDKALAIPCFASAAFSIAFLASGGRASWTEWTTVGLSYVVAVWLGWNANRLKHGGRPE